MFGNRIEDLVEATNKLDLGAESESDGSGTQALPVWFVKVGDEGGESGHRNKARERERTPRRIEACEIAEDGRLLIGVGENESIWIWRISGGEQVRRVSTSGEAR